MRLHSHLSKLGKAIVWTIAAGLGLIGGWCPAAPGVDTQTHLQTLIGDRDAILVSDPHDRIIFSKNTAKKLIPASTLKIFTALAALHYLGADYRFRTEFYLDKNQNLKIKGYGDPLLISEVLVDIAATLKDHLAVVDAIILDDTYFVQPLVIPGISSSTQPYDAPNGALCVNFNTVNFKTHSQKFVSAEPQTPLLPFALNRIKKTKLKAGRIVLSHERGESTLYAGYLFQYFINAQGIQTGNRVQLGRIQKANDKLIYTYVSRFSLEEIIIKLLEHSNNFTTNQLLITAGVQHFGPPGTLAKGVKAARVFAKDLLNLSDFNITEGSGISRDNRISAEDLHRILEAFQPHRRLMRHERGEYYKTGTLKGISTRVGYLENLEGKIYRYVVLMNTPGKSSDRIVKQLRSILDCGIR
jgi:D-alanyl-D-alanine carboxypeptidase/D-alanyl-D-alanine-endopeptidase (penicillin-binding protein 4)